MVRLAGVAKQGAEELSVGLENVEFRVEGRPEAIFQIKMPVAGECRGHAASVLGLNIVVVGLDDGFFAGEIVVGGAERSSGSGGEFAHGGGLEPTLAEDAERGGEEVGAGELGFGSGDGSIEHVQIVGKTPGIVKHYFRTRS